MPDIIHKNESYKLLGILEVKSCSSISDSHIAQAMNYLKVSGNRLAIIVNFNNDSLEYRRIII